MKISLKNKPLAYFSNNPGIAVVCMFIIVLSLVIVGTSQKEVTILDDGKKAEIVTYNTTVRDVLEQNKIILNPKDKISPGLEAVVTDGTKVSIKRAVPVTVTVDGRELQISSAEDTVEDMLAAEGVTYGEIDKVYPSCHTLISKDMNIKIVRVTEEQITEKEVLAYSNEIKEMPEWERGVDKLLREGSNGEKETSIKITYEDGVEAEREVVGEKVTIPAVSKLVAMGTLDWRPVGRGETIKFEKMMVMKATSYTDDIACTGKISGNTATGTKPTRNSDGSKWSTVAVDPRAIPLGTELWVEGYGYARAEDVGGAVKGSIIDLFFTNGSAEYENWHTHKVRVYILK
jgi:uncharacterized protein YabE (DUF348 family)